MTFVKVIKTKSYFSRFQVKFRRRRNGITDYYARKRLIHQDKNKYRTKKYRLIARITNKQIICQFAYATLRGDIIVAAASSSELPDYGVKVGLKNFSACYCTGLLAARRFLLKLKMDRKHRPSKEFGGEISSYGKQVKACLDVGLARCTTGAKIFACLKGAVDGGVEIPHDVTRYPGYSKEEPSKYEELLKSRIFGTHVADYMKELKEEDPQRFKKQFSEYVKHQVDPEKIEEMYGNAHKWIVQNPIKRDPKARMEKNKKIRQEARRKREKEHKAAPSLKTREGRRYKRYGHKLALLKHRKTIRTSQKIFLMSLAKKAAATSS